MSGPDKKSKKQPVNKRPKTWVCECGMVNFRGDHECYQCGQPRRETNAHRRKEQEKHDERVQMGLEEDDA